ncbi:G-type lectin S-receptor-like serine/threonine-protein kinase At2g19130 [Magnolia sinica]|uniref:G-type lectin S-receptor-like serine/threonine-protein kinase At2g19130 n=1 Tax=Magnolia sinica TaxID=86752 RepID=UPI002658F18D|nr:G-type lectin S-receptor-like serine/threonine-protein kinase At2g19130 [Magnolia sinica]
MTRHLNDHPLFQCAPQRLPGSYYSYVNDHINNRFKRQTLLVVQHSFRNSGNRNTKQSKISEAGYFPVWAAGKIKEGDVLCLLDHILEGITDMEELNRACRVACWCIQENEESRPLMGQVVQILEGVLEVSVPLIPRFLQNLVDNKETITSHTGSRTRLPDIILMV